jgi:hypothetical protein
LIGMTDLIVMPSPRASFLGRAIHSSFAAWQGRVKAILAKAGFYKLVNPR